MVRSQALKLAVLALSLGAGGGAGIGHAQVSGEATATLSAPTAAVEDTALAISPRPKQRPGSPPAAAPVDQVPETAAQTATQTAAKTVSPVAAPKPAVKPRDPSKGAVTNLPIPRFVSLKGNEGNARRGPSLTHRIDWVFTTAGMPLRVTAEHENWRRVEDVDGMGGWVHYALLSGVRTAMVTVDMAMFHTRPDAAANVAFQAERGVTGRLLECQPDWCRMNVQGEKGWIEKSALWGVLPGEVLE